MDAGYLTGRDDIFEDTIGFEHQVLAIGDLYLLADDRIDEGQFGQFTVEQVRQRLTYLFEGRFAHEHRMEDAVGWVGIGILSDTATREGSVTDIHREESVVHRLFAIDGKDHMLRFVLRDSPDEADDIVHMVRTDIVLEVLRFLAAERIHTETDRVDEVTVVLDVITPIGDATDIYRMTRSFEEAFEALFVVLGQSPVSTPVITRTTRHESHLYLRPLFRR